MSLNTMQNLSFSSVETKNDIYTDLSGLQNLKSSARKDADSALPEVARQFEAVMISTMMKNLRKTGMEDPYFKSQAMDSYNDMYDQQLGLEMSKGQGIGFAKSIIEQMRYQSGQHVVSKPGNNMPQRQNFPDYDLAKSVSSVSNEEKEAASGVLSSVQSELPIAQKIDATFKSPEQFVEKLWPLAEQAGQKLGVSAEMILSQSALETGWGKHIISNGQKSSYNLFNIKANQSWHGERMEKASTEFSGNDKSAVQQKSDFRSYDSFAQSFDDYVHLIKNNARYQPSFNQGSLNQSGEKMSQTERLLHDKNYIKGIHKAGYATDPDYSDKVLRVLKSEAIQSKLNIAANIGTG